MVLAFIRLTKLFLTLIGDHVGKFNRLELDSGLSAAYHVGGLTILQLGSGLGRIRIGPNNRYPHDLGMACFAQG